MLLRRITQHIKDQNWFAVFIDFFIVIAGVFIGIQVANWNEARGERERRDQIVDALVTDLRETSEVHQNFINRIDDGISKWHVEYEQGLMPQPYYYRIVGSDTAPDTWRTLEQMQLSSLFNPKVLFHLAFYYSERRGVGVKYLRYTTFVENHILPGEKQGSEAFYDTTTGKLKPEFSSNMDRLIEFKKELKRLKIWEDCLVKRLESNEINEGICLNEALIFDGVSQDSQESQ